MAKKTLKDLEIEASYSELNDFEKYEVDAVSRFLEKVDAIREKNGKEFELGFRLGVLLGDFQFYFRKLVEKEVLGLELKDDELTFISFYKEKELEFFGEETFVPESLSLSKDTVAKIFKKA